MKRVLLGLIILIASGITIYSIVFWQPEKEETLDGSNSDVSITGENIQGATSSEVINLDGDEYLNQNKSILKVNETTIERSLSKENKDKINEIIKGLSNVDIGKIENSLEDKDREKGIRQFLSILKMRLSSQDYEDIKIILEPYIEFDLVNKEV